MSVFSRFWAALNHFARLNTSRFIFHIAISVSSASYAADAKPPLQLITMTFPPYSFAEDGEIRGISVDIIKKVFEKLNTPISIEIIPWSRALRNMRLGASDGLFQVLHKPERTEFLDYCAEPLIEERVNLYVPADSTLKFSGDLQDLSSLSIGIRQDFSYGTAFDAAKAKGLFKHTDETGVFSLLLLLKHKRIDAVVGDQFGIPLTLNEYQSKLPGFKIKTFDSAINNQWSYLVFSKKRGLTAICEKFDEQLKAMKANGEYQAQIDKWGQI